MAKTLRVCSSEFLPPIQERRNNFIYFAYDKMKIFLGKNYYSDPFCIVEELPKNAVEGMLYITLEGDVKTIIDSQEIVIAYIEDQEQTQYLLDAGTVYFMKAEYRYLDMQSRLLILPFQNGMYQLSVNTANNLKIDENTVIRFNPMTNEFEIDGDYIEDPASPRFKGYVGSETDSSIVNVTDKIVSTDIKISSKAGNVLQLLGNGLYANIGDIATEESVQNLALLYANYKTSVDARMTQLYADMDERGFTLTEESLAGKIMTALKEYEPTVQEMIENYDFIYEQLGYIRDGSKQYADEKIDAAKEEILSYIRNITNAWEEFSYEGSPQEQELYSQEENEIQAKMLEELRKQFVSMRETEDVEYIDVDMYMNVIGDIEATEEITLIPKSLVINSEAGSKVGNSYLLVSPLKEEGNRYFYKVTDTNLKYNQSIDGMAFIEWDGKSEITVTDNVSVLLVETDKDMLAKKCGRFISVSRLENSKELDILNIISTEGSEVGYSKLLISPTKQPGNIYMFKPATKIPEYNSIISEDYKEWDGISEFNQADYDMQLMAFVECTADFHRAVRFGLINIDLANELLKILSFISERGYSPMGSIITEIYPVLEENHTYFYKVGESIELPKVNSYVDESWYSYTEDQEIIVEDFTNQVIIVECDPSNKIKKAGIINNMLVNNTLVGSLSYDRTQYMKNIVSFEQYEGGQIYYKLIGQDEIVSNNYYGDEIEDGYVMSTDNTVVIETDKEVSIIEAYNGKVRRHKLFEPVIEYAEELNIELSLTDNNVTINGIIVDSMSKYYIQILTVEDNKQYILNEPIKEDLFIEWDGISAIQLGDDMSDILGIKVVVTGYNGNITGFGKSELYNV